MADPTMDRYDDQIAGILHVRDTEGDDAGRLLILEQWSEAEGLFACAGVTGSTSDTTVSGDWCGCLTQIRSGRYVAATDVLTVGIVSDERIPDSEADIDFDDLPVFAEWQRRIDREIRGKGV